jgi:xanthine/uracil permease
MLQRIRKNSFTIAGLIIGLAAGYLYWYFVGCANGTCLIQSSPWRMTPYGGMMGALTGNIVQDFIRRRKANVK